MNARLSWEVTSVVECRQPGELLSGTAVNRGVSRTLRPELPVVGVRPGAPSSQAPQFDRSARPGHHCCCTSLVYSTRRYCRGICGNSTAGHDQSADYLDSQPLTSNAANATASSASVVSNWIWALPLRTNASPQPHHTAYSSG